MVFSVAAATARRRIAVMARKHVTQPSAQTQRRAMGGGHAPAPEWEGIDKVVRGVFPGDHQLAMAIMGGYLGLYLIFTIKGAITKKPIKGEPAITPAMIAGDASAGEGMPAVDSPEFDSFIASDRFTKMLESDDFGNTA